MLVNLLIAKMSDTFAHINEQGELRWCFERAQLIDEFKDFKTPLPPPFNLLWLLFVSIPSHFHRRYRERLFGEELLVENGFKVGTSASKKCVLRASHRESRCAPACYSHSLSLTTSS